MWEEQIAHLLEGQRDEKEISFTIEQKDKKIKKLKDLKLKRINPECYPTNKSSRKRTQRTCGHNIYQTY